MICSNMRWSRISKYIIFYIILISFFNNIILLTPSTEASAISSEVEINLIDPDQIVDVSPGSKCKVEFEGFVRVQSDLDTEILVIFELGADWNRSKIKDYNLVIVPNTLRFNGAGLQIKNFKVSLNLPLYTHCSFTGSIVVFGNWYVYEPYEMSGKCEPVTGTIEIEQFHRIRMRVPNRNYDLLPDEECYIRLYVANNGNVDETVLLNVKNIDLLEDKGFKITPSSMIIEIPSKEEYDYRIRVKPPDGIQNMGSYNVEIEISISNSTGGIGEYQFKSFRIRVGYYRYYGPIFLCSTLIILLILLIIIIFKFNKKRKKRKMYRKQIKS